MNPAEIGTVFRNFLFPGGQSELIETHTELPVWDTENKRWVDGAPTIYRNSLIFAIHPYTKRIVVALNPNGSLLPSLLDPFVPPGFEETLSLEMAGNSRSHGRVIFSSKQESKNYFGEGWRNLIYGSIMLTTNKQLYASRTGIFITDDTNRNELGYPEDYPPSGFHFGTHDSAGRATTSLMGFMSTYNDPDRPVQFRAAVPNEWCAKGVLSRSRNLDRIQANFPVDLAIPQSSTKGNKPKLALYRKRIVLGTVQDAWSDRVSKVPWMLLQWFSFETLEKDGIVSNLRKQCQDLSSALELKSIKEVAKVLRINVERARTELELPDGEYISERKYISNLEKIIVADEHGVLLRHPYVVSEIVNQTRAMWLNLAKSAGMVFKSFMVQGDDTLHLEDKAIFCCRQLPEGWYIVHPNPMRTADDCALWENVHTGRFKDSPGIFAASQEWLITIGRDSDGDSIQVSPAWLYPNMAEEVKTFESWPTEKPDKIPVAGTLQEVAVRSVGFSERVGTVAALTARAQAAKCIDQFWRIPYSNGTWIEMRLGSFLAQQLQILVDSAKSDTPPNDEGLKYVKSRLNEQKIFVPWLSSFKDKATYRDRPCAVDPEATDTMSELVKIVNSYWKPADFGIDESPRSFKDVLFSDVVVEDPLYQETKDYIDWYRFEMAKAIKFYEEFDDNSRIRGLVASSREHKLSYLDLNPSITPHTMAAAFWQISHEAQTGRSSICFNMFIEEIIDELGQEREVATMIRIYKVDEFAGGSKRWTGEAMFFEATRVYHHSKDLMAIAGSPNSTTQLATIGLVGEEHIALVPDGYKFEGNIRSLHYNLKSETTSALLFDKSILPEEQIVPLMIDIGHYMLRIGFTQNPKVVDKWWEGKVRRFYISIGNVGGRDRRILNIARPDNSLVRLAPLLWGNDSRFLPNSWYEMRLVTIKQGEDERGKFNKIRVFDSHFLLEECWERINNKIPPDSGLGGTIG